MVAKLYNVLLIIDFCSNCRISSRIIAEFSEINYLDYHGNFRFYAKYDKAVVEKIMGERSANA